MIKSSSIGIIAAVISTVGFGEGKDIPGISTIADYGVLAGMIIGGLTVTIKFLEVLSEQVRKWFEYLDKKRAAKAQQTQNKKPSD